MIDYIKIPQKLIYKRKTSLEEFGVYEEGTINADLFNYLISFEELRPKYRGAFAEILSILNRSYYLLILVLHDRNPLEQYAEYTQLAGSFDKWELDSNYSSEEREGFVMAILFAFLMTLGEKLSTLQKRLVIFLRDDIHSKNNLPLQRIVNKYKIPISNYTCRDIQELIDSKESLQDCLLAGNILGEIVDTICKDNDQKLTLITRLLEPEKEGYGALDTNISSAYRSLYELRSKLTGEPLPQVLPFERFAKEMTCPPPNPNPRPYKYNENNTNNKSDERERMIELLEPRISKLEAENQELRNKNNNLKSQVAELNQKLADSINGQSWIDWLDDDVFKPNFNAEKIAEAIKVIVAPHLSTHCYWYVVYRVLDKIHWLIDGATQKAFLKWANAHFSLGWKGEQQFKFSEINDSIKKVADIDDWDKYTMKTNQGQYYAELRDKLYKVFVEKLPNGKLFDRTEFIKQGQLRVNNGH